MGFKIGGKLGQIADSAGEATGIKAGDLVNPLGSTLDPIRFAREGLDMLPGLGSGGGEEGVPEDVEAAAASERARREAISGELEALFGISADELADLTSAEAARRAEGDEIQRLLQDEFLIQQGLRPADFRVTEAQATLDDLISQRAGLEARLAGVTGMDALSTEEQARMKSLQDAIGAAAPGSQMAMQWGEELAALESKVAAARETQAGSAQADLDALLAEIGSAEQALSSATGAFESRENRLSEAQRLIDEQAELAIERGTADIDEGVRRQLEMLREEAGAARGLRFTDTPVFDDAQRVSAEGVRQTGQLALGVRQGQTQQALNQANLQTQQNFQQQQFQAGLAQQALNNRMALFGQHTGFGLNLINTTPSSQEFLLGLRGTREQQQSMEDKLLGGGFSVLTGLSEGGYFNKR